MKKKILIIILSMLILTVIMNYFIPLPIKIDKKINAVEIIPEDNNFCKPVTMSIKGVYYFSLIANDSFKGRITLDGWERYEGEINTQLFFSHGHSEFNEFNTSHFEILGELYTSHFPDNFVINVYSREDNDTYGWNGATGHCIIGPANNRDEAIAIYRTVANKTRLPYLEF
jgi:hypothetical protein